MLCVCCVVSGADVSVSPVMGKGFPVEKIPADANQTVLMFATGISHYSYRHKVLSTLRHPLLVTAAPSAQFCLLQHELFRSLLD